MFGINGGELVIILVVAVIVVGPERLPQFAEQLARAVRKGKTLLNETKEKVGSELGPEMQDVDWQKLDPRQYDPRRIVRETLLEDTVLDPNYEAKKAAKSMGATTAATAAAGLAPGVQTSATPPTVANPYAGSSFETYRPLAQGVRAPFESEAT